MRQRLTLYIVIVFLISGCRSISSIENTPKVTVTNQRNQSVLPPPSNFLRIVKLAIQDDKNGWVLAEDEQGYSQLFQTNDINRNWNNRTPWDMKNNVFLFVLDSSNVWGAWEDYPAKKLYIWHTNDHGRSWITSSLSEDLGESGAGFHNLYFISSQEGWLHVTHHSGLGYSVSELYYTKDGGITWVPIISSTDADKKLSSEGNKGLVMFKNQKEGFLGTSLSGTTPYWYRSYDKGFTWLKEPLLPSTIEKQKENQIFTVNIPYFFNKDQGVTSVSSNQGYSIYSTNDGGKTWATHTPFKSKNVDQLTPVDSTHLWAVDNQFTLINTSGSLDKWEISNTSDKITGKENTIITAIDFISPKEGWLSAGKIGNSTELYHTTDGGKTWIIAKPSISTKLKQ